MPRLKIDENVPSIIINKQRVVFMKPVWPMLASIMLKKSMKKVTLEEIRKARIEFLKINPGR